MANYEVDRSYNLRQYDTVVLEAEDREDAEYRAMNMLLDGNLDISGVTIEEVKEIG